MAAEEFMLSINADFSQAERATAEFYARNKARAADVAATTGGKTPLAQLPKEAKAKLVDNSKNEKLATAELSKQRAIQQELVQQKASLIALAQQEARVTAKAAGKTVSKAELGKIRSVGETSLAGNLGLDKLTPAIKGQLTASIRTIETAFDTALAGLSGKGLQTGFQKASAPVLAAAGITQKTSVAQADTQVRRVAQQEESFINGINADIKANKETEAKATSRTAKVAQEDAADAEAAAAQNRQARKRTTTALNEQAAAAEAAAAATATAASSAAASLKFTRETAVVNGQKRNTGDLIARTGPGERDRYQIAKSPGNDGGYNLTYPGRGNPDDVFATQREAKAAAQAHLAAEQERLVLVQKQIADEAESLAISDAQNAAETENLVATETEAAARGKSAAAAVNAAALAESLLSETASSKAAQTQYTAAVAKLTAAQQRALATIVANPGATRAETGVPANTLKSLQTKGFVTDDGSGRIAAVNAEIFAVKQAQLGETAANAGAEAASATITAASVLTEEEIAGILKKMKASIAAGAVSAQEASAGLAAIGISASANSLAPAKPKTPAPNNTAISASQLNDFEEATPITSGTKKTTTKKRTTTQDRVSAKEKEGEDELLAALTGKARSLRAQKKAIDVRLPKLREAEDALIRALNGKASSLSSQTKSSKTRDKKIKEGEAKNVSGGGGGSAAEEPAAGSTVDRGYQTRLGKNVRATQIEGDPETGALTEGETLVIKQQIAGLAAEEVLLRKQQVDLLSAMVAATELQLVSQAGIDAATTGALVANEAYLEASLQAATAEQVLANKKLTNLSASDDGLAALAERNRLQSEIDRKTRVSPQQQAVNKRVDQQAVRDSISPREAAQIQIATRQEELKKLRGLAQSTAVQDQIVAIESEIILLRRAEVEATRASVLASEQNATTELQRARNNAVQKAIRTTAKDQVAREDLAALGAETKQTRDAATTVTGTKTLSSGRVVDTTQIDRSLLDARSKEFLGRREAGIAVAKQVLFEEEATRLAAQRNAQLLSNGQKFTQYNQAVDFVLSEELQIIKLQEKRLLAEIKSGKDAETGAILGQAEIKERQDLLVALAQQARAARAVAAGTAKPGTFVAPNATQQAAAARASAVQTEAQYRNLSQLGGGVAPAYRVTDIKDGKLNVDAEKEILKQQISLAEKDRENVALSDQERQARTLLIKEVRARLAALVAADNSVMGVGNGPKAGSTASKYYEGDPADAAAKQAADDARLAAKERQTAANRINRERDKDPFAYKQKQAATREAVRRVSGNSVALTDAEIAAANTVQLQLEQETIAQQLLIIKAKAAQVNPAATQAALEQEISVLQKQEALLRSKVNDSLKVSGASGGVVPPVKPPKASGGSSSGGGNQFGSGIKNAPGAAGFFGGGLLTTLKYSIPSLLLFSAASGISDSIKEAEQLQYVLSKLESQVDSVFGPDATEAAATFKSAIIGVSIDAGLAADELAKTSLKIIGTFSTKTIDGQTGQVLVENQITALGKLQRVTGLTAKELENDYSAISLAFDTTFENIADKVVAISDVTGIDANELGNFAGDIATVLTEAGFSLDEALALGATSAQSSGKSISAISEAYGRVIPELANQTSELNKLAAENPQLNTPEFVDAVRLQDASKILTIIGEQYDGLSKQAQVDVTNLFGRREAQSVLPGIKNRKGYEDALNAAENSSGRFEDRFQKVMNNLSSKLAKLGEEVRILFKKLLEGGLGEVLDTLLNLGSLLAKGLGAGVSALAKLNDLMGGLPVKILAAAAAWKILNLAQSGLSGLGGRFAAFGTGAGLAPGGRYAPNFVSRAMGAYQVARNPITAQLPAGVAGPQIAPSVPLGKFGALGQSGKSLVASLGGGSFAVGASFIGIAALTTLYSQINNRIEADKAAMAKLSEELRTDTSDLDLTDESVRNQRVSQLETLQKQAEVDVAGFKDDWKRFWDGLFNIQSEAGVYAIEAIKAGRDPEKIDVLKETSDSLKEKIIAQYGNVDTTVAAKDFGAAGFVNDIPVLGPIFENTVGRAFSVIPGFDTGQAKNKAQEDAVKKLLSIKDFNDAQEEVLAALRSENQVKELQKIVDTSTNTDAVEQAAAALDNAAQELLTGDSRAARAYRFLKARQDRRNAELKELENSKSISDLSELSNAYNNGVISLEEYLKRSSDEIGNIQASLRPGGSTVASEEEKLAAAVAIDEGRKQQTQAILDEQDKQTKIAEALGATPESIAATQVAAAKANLADPNFTDDDKRLEAALLIVQAQGKAELAIARKTGDLQKVYDILKNGFDVPTETMALLITETAKNDQGFKDFQTAYDKYIKSSFGSITPQALSGPDGRGLNAEDLLSKVATETFSPSGLTAETEDALANQIRSTQAFLDANPNMDEDLRKTFEASVDYWVELLQLGQVDIGTILNALSGGKYYKTKPGSSERKAIEDKYAEILGGYGFDPEAIKAMVDAQTLADQKALSAARAGYYKSTGDRGGYLEALVNQKNDNAPAADAARAKSVLDRNKEDWDALREEAEIDNEIKNLAKEARDAKNGYLAAVARVSGDITGAISIEIAGLQEDLKATNDPVEQDKINTEIVNKFDELRKQGVADANAMSKLAGGLANLRGDLVEAALYALQEANNNAAAARTPQEKADAALAQAQASADLIKAQFTEKARDYDLFAAYLEANGDSLGAAKTNLVKAQESLKAAIRGGNKNDINAARIELLNQESAFRKKQGESRDNDFKLLSAILAGEDPVKQAIVEQAAATEALARAIGPDEIRDATIRLIDANKAMASARAEVRLSMMNLRQAEAQAMEDEVGAAQIGVEIARQQLNDLIAAGAGDAAINNGRAALITADKAAKDAVFNERKDEYKWLLDMGKISKSQYVDYLEGLKNELIPGTKQFKDLELSIKQLKDDIGGDLQANLPTSLRLPTLYEVRRFDQTGASSGGATAGGVGYQDNRQVAINVNIDGASQDVAGQVVQAMQEFAGIQNNGYGVRRF